MSKKNDVDGGISSPDDSLSNYFDDLLGGGFGDESLLDHALAAIDEQVLPVAASSGGARIVSLPTKALPAKKVPDTKQKPEHKPKKVNLRVEPVSQIAPKTQSDSIPTYAEPEPIQSIEQKLKLERLLQSARPQLLAEAKSEFINNPEEIQDWVIESPITEIAPLETIVEAIADPELVAPAPQFQIDGLEWLENGRPQWAQSRFDVLLFSVAGLTLAVPLISLGQIQPLTDELTPLFGQADWFMGLQPTPAGKIRTVNTAKFVMPERYDEAFVQTAKYVMSINGVPWGLAVDSVNQPITLQPEDVKWRGDRSKRPWLAGTVKEHMCALLDIPRIGQMLIDADKNFVPA